MKHLFVPHTIAVLADQKGFNEPCLAKYDNYPNNGIDFIWEKIYPETYITKEEILRSEVLAPLYQQLVDWFLTEHNLFIEITLWESGFNWMIKETKKDGVFSKGNGDRHYKTKLDALNTALTEAFKLIP